MITRMMKSGMKTRKIPKKELTFSLSVAIIERQFGDVPKWLKGPHSKCGRSGNRRESSNLSISAERITGNGQKLSICPFSVHLFLDKCVFFLYNFRVVKTTAQGIGQMV